MLVLVVVPPTPVAGRVNAERVVLLGWSRAILLQVAHPLVAAGVAGHSSFRDSPVRAARRLHHTVRAMLQLTFGSESEQALVIANIRAIHRRVHGVLGEPVGTYAAGTPYSAEDPALVLWVHATLLESVVLVYESVVGALTPAERDAYCLEAVWVPVALGARQEDVPRDWAGLLAYLDAMHGSGRIAVGSQAREVARALLQGPFAALVGPMGWANRELTVGWLPPSIRAGYGFAWHEHRERRFQRLVAGVRRARRLLPSRVALWPAALRVA